MLNGDGSFFIELSGRELRVLLLHYRHWRFLSQELIVFNFIRNNLFVIRLFLVTGASCCRVLSFNDLFLFNVHQFVDPAGEASLSTLASKLLKVLPISPFLDSYVRWIGLNVIET